MTDKQYSTYKAFYPFYLSQHLDPTCRALHYIGTSLVLGVLIYALVSQRWGLLVLLPLCGYFFAWVGHFGFEKNRPATFTYPLWSLMADFHMYFDFLTGRLERRITQLSHDEQL